MDNVNAIETLATLAGAQRTGVRKNAAFDMAFYYLERRISLFRNLPLKSRGQSTLGTRLCETGQTAGAANHCPHVA